MLILRYYLNPSVCILIQIYTLIVFYVSTIKLVPSVEYPTYLDNSPTPTHIQIASTISGLDIRLTYIVEPIGSDSDDDQSKFSVSLDDDGDRVAVGYKESGRGRSKGL